MSRSCFAAGASFLCPCGSELDSRDSTCAGSCSPLITCGGGVGSCAPLSGLAPPSCGLGIACAPVGVGLGAGAPNGARAPGGPPTAPTFAAAPSEPGARAACSAAAAWARRSARARSPPSDGRAAGTTGTLLSRCAGFPIVGGGAGCVIDPAAAAADCACACWSLAISGWIACSGFTTVASSSSPRSRSKAPPMNSSISTSCLLGFGVAATIVGIAGATGTGTAADITGGGAGAVAPPVKCGLFVLSVGSSPSVSVPSSRTIAVSSMTIPSPARTSPASIFTSRWMCRSSSPKAIGLWT